MSEPTGDCYEAAMQTLIDMPKEMRPFARLCHGIVTGNGEPVVGVRFGHAWVELGGAAIDNSNGKGSVRPVEQYYDHGSIEPNEVVKYTYDEMCVTMLRFRTYGPWTDEHPNLPWLTT